MGSPPRSIASRQYVEYAVFWSASLKRAPPLGDNQNGYAGISVSPHVTRSAPLDLASQMYLSSFSQVFSLSRKIGAI